MRISLQPAFVLHSRPFNETSSLLDVMTSEYGRINLIARAIRSSRSPLRGLLRPFNPLLVSWSGKTELMSLSAVEQSGTLIELSGRALLSGLYVNELLVKLLHRFDPHPALFKCYQDVLRQLLQSNNIEKSLRLFEQALLGELGYGLELNYEAETGSAILPDKNYHFVFETGLLSNDGSNSALLNFKGQELLSFHHGELERAEDLKAAKRLTRYVLNELLIGKQLKSRDLFRN